MPRTIVIIGGLSDDSDRDSLLGELREKSGPGIEWDWVKADEQNAYHVENRDFNALRRILSDKRHPEEKPCVVQLFRLNGREANKLFACSTPLVVPKRIDCRQSLVEWLFSPEANLIPRPEWHANCEEAALVAVLTKLIKNKSWNKDTHGHAWTKEADLLGQAPVFRPEFPEIAREAANMLLQLRNVILLRKGGTHGKTPKEWSIDTAALPAVKQMIIEQSVTPLLAIRQLIPHVERIRKQNARPYRLDGEVVTERVRHTCRSRRA